MASKSGRQTRRPYALLHATVLAVAAVALGAAFAPASWLGACPTIFKRWRAKLAIALPALQGMLGISLEEARRAGLKEYTLARLAQCDGRDGKPLLLGMNGDVFDVGPLGSQFYGPGAPYSVFAGKDCTRALTLGVLDEDEVALTDISDFGPQELSSLAEQHAFYLGKYPLVGWYWRQPPPSLPAEANAEAGEAPRAGGSSSAGRSAGGMTAVGASSSPPAAAPGGSPSQSAPHASEDEAAAAYAGLSDAQLLDGLRESLRSLMRLKRAGPLDADAPEVSAVMAAVMHLEREATRRGIDFDEAWEEGLAEQ